MCPSSHRAWADESAEIIPSVLSLNYRSWNVPVIFHYSQWGIHPDWKACLPVGGSHFASVSCSSSPSPFLPLSSFLNYYNTTITLSEAHRQPRGLLIFSWCSFHLFTPTVSQWLFFFAFFFYLVKCLTFNHSTSTEEMAELLFLSQRGKQWWVFHHKDIDSYTGSLFSEAVIIPTLCRSITLHCSHYGTCEPVMILYYNGIDLVEGLAPNERCCEDHRPSTDAGFTTP